MTIKEQVLAISAKLSALPSDALIKVLLVFVKPALAFWVAEVNKHHDAMTRYPAGSAMHKAASAAYDTAFGHWHRVSYLVMKIEEAGRFQGLASTGQRPRLGKPVEPAESVQQAA